MPSCCAAWRSRSGAFLRCAVKDKRPQPGKVPEIDRPFEPMWPDSPNGTKPSG